MQIFVPRNPASIRLSAHIIDNINIRINAHQLNKLEPYILIVAEDVVAAYEQLHAARIVDSTPDLVVPLAGDSGIVEAITNTAFARQPGVFVSIYHDGEILVWEALAGRGLTPPDSLDHRGSVIYDPETGASTLGPAKIKLSPPKNVVPALKSDHQTAPVSDEIRAVAESLLADREYALDCQLADILADLERIPGKIAASRVHASASVRARRQSHELIEIAHRLTQVAAVAATAEAHAALLVKE